MFFFFGNTGTGKAVSCQGADTQEIFISEDAKGHGADLFCTGDIVSFTLDLDLATFEVHINQELAFKFKNFKPDAALYPYVRCCASDELKLVSCASYVRLSTAGPAFRLSLAKVVGWLTTTWASLQSDQITEEDKNLTAGKGEWSQHLIVSVLSEFSEALRGLVQNSEIAAEGQQQEMIQHLTTFLTRAGMHVLIKELFLLGYAITRQNSASESQSQLLGMLASFASLLDRAIVISSSIVVSSHDDAAADEEEVVVDEERAMG